MAKGGKSLKYQQEARIWSKFLSCQSVSPMVGKETAGGRSEWRPKKNLRDLQMLGEF